MAMSTTGEFISNVQKEIEGLQSKIASLEEKKSEIDKQITETRLDIKRRRDLLLVWEGKADVRPLVERHGLGGNRRLHTGYWRGRKTLLQDTRGHTRRYREYRLYVPVE